jgi:hypothetical protein
MQVFTPARQHADRVALSSKLRRHMLADAALAHASHEAHRHIVAVPTAVGSAAGLSASAGCCFRLATGLTVTDFA